MVKDRQEVRISNSHGVRVAAQLRDEVVQKRIQTGINQVVSHCSITKGLPGVFVLIALSRMLIICWVRSMASGLCGGYINNCRDCGAILSKQISF